MNPAGNIRTIDGLSAPGGAIFLRKGAVDWQNMTHEVIHKLDFAFLIDPNMLLFLNRKYKIDPNGSSQQISNLIKGKCK